jgi:glutaminyl-tRNA synthetase
MPDPRLNQHQPSPLAPGHGDQSASALGDEEGSEGRPAREEQRAPERRDFLREMVQEDLASGRVERVVTRFPPEPNGYLHIGHAKAIYLNFDIAREFGGRCNLRMDDTNPTKEDVEYVDSIRADVRWLIGGWAEHVLGLKPLGALPEKRLQDGREDFYLPAVRPEQSGAQELEPFYASDYFEPLYEYAVELIRRGKAFVCDHTPGEVDAMRGAPDRPGAESEYRDRSVDESLDLFARMRAGEFPDGARTLRAKIDMRSPNLWLRDPVLYRIRHASHHHTGDAWCIYPMYDFAHGLSDYIEGVTHSLCTLEFEVHRPLYDWFLEALDLPRTHPQQREFARLNLTYTVMSKRKLLRLVEEGHVRGWDDPRLPTISGMRRRGYPAEAVRAFCDRIGVAKRENMVELGLLEHFVRDELNRSAPRAMAVLRPLRVVIENYPEGQVEEMEVVNHPEDPAAGTRRVPFSRVVYIERDDFREVPPPKYRRMSPGVEVRLRQAYLVTCTDVVKDPDTGEVVEVRAKYDPATRGGDAPDGRKVKATIHWVSAEHALDAEVRLYDTLFTAEDPEDTAEGEDFTSSLNPESLEILRGGKLEPSLAEAAPGARYQFERLGYFCADPQDSRPGAPVFNRTVGLKDAWAKIEKKQK